MPDQIETTAKYTNMSEHLLSLYWIENMLEKTPGQPILGGAKDVINEYMYIYIYPLQ